MTDIDVVLVAVCGAFTLFSFLGLRFNILLNRRLARRLSDVSKQRDALHRELKLVRTELDDLHLQREYELSELYFGRGVQLTLDGDHVIASENPYVELSYE
jgi:hypothetical protein